MKRSKAVEMVAEALLQTVGLFGGDEEEREEVRALSKMYRLKIAHSVLKVLEAQSMLPSWESEEMTLEEFFERYEKAIQWAKKYHSAQKYGSAPYIKHLQDVEAVLAHFGFHPKYNNLDRILYIGAWLHDIIEDCNVTVEELRENFGDDVAHLVFAVSNEPGKNRKERHEKTYPKIRASGLAATILKLADRIANVEASIQGSEKLFKMYQSEYPDFRKSLHREVPISVIYDMWAHLDGLVIQTQRASEEALAPTNQSE